MARWVIRPNQRSTWFKPHGQNRLGTIQRLNLALFIDTQHQGVVGRVQVEADNIAYLLDEEQVGRDLKAPAAMRLNCKRLEQTMHRRFRNPARLGRFPNAPVGSSSGLARYGALQQGGNLLLIDRACPPWTQLVIQPSEAVFHKPLPPLADGRISPVQAAGNLAVALPLRRPQHQPGTGHQGMGQAARSGQIAQLALLVGGQLERGFGASGDHGRQLNPTLTIKTRSRNARPPDCNSYEGPLSRDVKVTFCNQADLWPYGVRT